MACAGALSPTVSPPTEHSADRAGVLGYSQGEIERGGTDVLCDVWRAAVTQAGSTLS